MHDAPRVMHYSTLSSLLVASTRVLLMQYRNIGDHVLEHLRLVLMATASCKQAGLHRADAPSLSSIENFGAGNRVGFLHRAAV